jgi:hypothetical protein
MWSIILLAVASHAQDKKCPIFTCSSSVSDKCLSIIGSTVVYSLCPPTYSCPNFNLANPQDVYCSRAIEEPPLSHECPKYLDLGNTCTISTYCDPEYFCSYDLSGYKGVCLARRDLGEYCSQTEECSVGNICNKGFCVPQLSVEVGQPANHFLACASGILKDGVCAAASLTINGNPGKECKNDNDCTASDGAAGECVCAANQNQKSFCKYNKSDPPILKALQYRFDGYRAQAKLKMYQAISYPIIDYAEECLNGDAQELTYERMLKAVADKCGAAAIGAAILLTLSFLLI